ncbi:Restriction endonuclease S subunit [Streptococcus pneumoniae]|nr:Restriction endonuclease S subunit [Streptococcus pneumoniae]COF10609.1 Restriction endonuclease S subunit [Streptococcus pneumoniae]COP26924.1 Restriction endonuclease S subunit [Streptococcus pneumoniae]COP55367.1 Restriction endonuclease S subunit [Streptococcus pneumoniae]CRG01029.1 Restriction endonuclease S subunit [Streptococcus pneumoniae]
MSKNVPEVRFGGSSEEWRINKLEEIVDRVTRKNSKLESTLPLTISAQHGLVDQITFFNKQVASKDVSSYYLLEKGEFAYNKSYSKGFPWGAVKRLDKYEKGVLSTLYIVFKPNHVNSDFLLSYYDTNRWHKEVSMRAAEGARNHGLLNITAKDFFETELKMPSTAIEQQKIGALFKQLDDMIALQQQLVEQQQQYKKAMLQKMFPQKGERVPKVRFEGFSGDWEETLFGDLYKVSSGFAFKREDYVKEGVHIVNGESIQHGEVFSNYWNYLPSDFLNKYEGFILKTDDIVLGLNRPITNNLLKIAKVPANLNNSLLYQRAGKVNFKTDNMSKEFSYQIIENEIYKFVKKEAVGSDQPFISTTKLEKWSFLYPVNFSEQQKIGTFFRQLDDTIALHQKKLEDYHQLKKALLQRMFV